MTWLGILENIVADIAFILLAIVASMLWISLTRRRKLQLFFGVSSSKRLVMYVSNLRVLAFGAAGISGRKMSYQGSSVAYGEMQAANRLRDLFSFIVPSIAETSDLLSKLLVSDVTVQLSISPLSKDNLELVVPFISLGSPAYNIASQYIEEDADSSAKFRLGVLQKSGTEVGPYGLRPTAFSTDAEPIVMPSGTASFDPSLLEGDFNGQVEDDATSAIIVNDIPPFEDPTYGFVERLPDSANERMLFYVAGLSEHSTEGATLYLVSEWANLYRKYGAEKPFLVMVRVDLADSKKWSVILEKDLSKE